jgi:hypothetical protein
MDKTLHIIINGAFTLIKAPLLLLLMASIVISVVRRRPRELAPAPVRKPLPPA